jgi:hypothetical protein
MVVRGILVGEFLDFSELGMLPVVVSDHGGGGDRPHCRSEVLCGKLDDTAQPKCSVLSS